MTKLFSALFQFFTSLKVTIWGLVGYLILVFVGTLDQVNLGIYYAQQKYFHSLFLYWPITDTFSLPIFPGGLLLGWLLVLNLIAVIIKRKLYRRSKWGLFLIHFGLIVLLFGGGLTSMVAIESQLVFEEGEHTFYSKDMRHVELVLIDGAHEDHDQVISIPGSLLEKEETISHADLPFSVIVHAFYPNALVSRLPTGQTNTSILNGLGQRLKVEQRPLVVRDDELNNETAIVSFKVNDTVIGPWLVARVLGQGQTVHLDGVDYQIRLRAKRYYMPYSLGLKNFDHDRYAGTNIPKNFSSLVEINHPKTGENREYLIYMNHPLRYDGKTYYQASFGKNDTLSVLQVVENPGWLLPYISCLLISLGMGMTFFTHLMRFMNKRKGTL